MAIFSICLIGCSSSNTNSGITQGKDTEPFSGNFVGVLELLVTINLIGSSPIIHNDSATMKVSITGNGIVHLIIDEYVLAGHIDDDGNWELQTSISDFGFVIDEMSTDTLRMAGCSLGKKFAKFEGQATPPIMSGEVSGKLYCKNLFATVGTLEVSGTLTATM
jgi:hypothetical protein